MLIGETALIWRLTHARCSRAARPTSSRRSSSPTRSRPARAPRVNIRLPLAATVHTNRYDEAAQEPAIESYDARRAELRPYGSQREPEKFGELDLYGWSHDKARQYAVPQRADFGAYIRRKGFDPG